MPLQDLAILLSIALTVPLLGISIWVLEEWLPSVSSHLAFPEFWSARDWLIVGICLSFTGSIGDNLWWGMAWLLRFLHESSWEWWFDHGVYSNVIFRQGFKLAAGYCHLRAAVETGALSRRLLSTMMATLWLCAAIAVFGLVICER